MRARAADWTSCYGLARWLGFLIAWWPQESKDSYLALPGAKSLCSRKYGGSCIIFYGPDVDVTQLTFAIQVRGEET